MCNIEIPPCHRKKSRHMTLISQYIHVEILSWISRLAHSLRNCYMFDTTVDGSEIPNNHLGWCLNPVNDGTNYQSNNFNWWSLPGFLVAINRVSTFVLQQVNTTKFRTKLPPPRKSRNVVAVNSPSLSLDELRWRDGMRMSRYDLGIGGFLTNNKKQNVPKFCVAPPQGLPGYKYNSG